MKKQIIKEDKYLNFLLVLSACPNNSSIWNLFVQYYQIWSPFQWFTSLVTLIIIYWMSGYFYNKFLSYKGGWMDWKTRLAMISADLILNFSLGAYYMNHRDTLMGALMVQCPIFLSPLFWIIELICFYIYYRYIFPSKKI